MKYTCVEDLFSVINRARYENKNAFSHARYTNIFWP